MNADAEILGSGKSIQGYNLFAYCMNNPINISDPDGNWPKWLSGAINIVSGGCQVVAGFALGATAGWTGVGAVAAVALIANGTGTVGAGVGQVINSATNSNTMPEENPVRTASKTIGKAIGGDTGQKIGAGVYDAANTAADLYSIGGGIKTVAKTANAIKTAEQVISIEKTAVTIKGFTAKPFADTYLATYRFTDSLMTAQRYVTVAKPWMRAVDGIGFAADRANNVINIFNN